MQELIGAVFVVGGGIAFLIICLIIEIIGGRRLIVKELKKRRERCNCEKA